MDYQTATFGVDDLPCLEAFLLTAEQAEFAGLVSVVPAATSNVLDVLKRYLPSLEIHLISHDDVPLRNCYPEPTELGIDRLLSSYAAHELYAKPENSPVIVADFGTANTYNCVSTAGEFLGGCISLGVGSTLRALHQQTARLPEVTMAQPNSMLATDTEDAIRAGVMLTVAGGMTAAIMLYTDIAFGGADPVVVGTGGYAEMLRHYGAVMDILDENLLLEGVSMICERILKERTF
jgi:type III pantothenate kinase